MGNSSIWFPSTTLPSDASVRLMSGASPSTFTDVLHARNLEANRYGGGHFDQERDLRRHIRGKASSPLPPADSRPEAHPGTGRARPRCWWRCRCDPVCRVGQSDLRAGNRCARRVGNAAIQLTGGLRRSPARPARSPKPRMPESRALLPAQIECHTHTTARCRGCSLADGFASST